MDTFTPENIRLDVLAADKDAALSSIAAFAVERGYSDDAEGVLAGLRDREEQMSTALMDGIAIPHAKHDAVTSAALLVQRYQEPIEWSDQQVRVNLAMLVPAAEGGNAHLALLAKVSRALIEDDVREALNTGDAATIFAALNSKLS